MESIFSEAVRLDAYMLDVIGFTRAYDLASYWTNIAVRYGGGYYGRLPHSDGKKIVHNASVCAAWLTNQLEDWNCPGFRDSLNQMLKGIEGGPIEMHPDSSPLWEDKGFWLGMVKDR